MLAGRAVSYELQDYDEDDEDFAMVCAEMKQFQSSLIITFILDEVLVT